MTKSVDIQPLSHSVYEAADSEKLRIVLDGMIQAARGTANWKARKKAMLDIITTLERATIALHAASVAASKDTGEISDIANDDPEEVFLKMLPMYIGAILEKLEEQRITCIEQAAFYMLSIHPEHQEAAQAWIDSDYRHFKEFKRFLAANRDYQRILSLGSDMAAGQP